MTDETEQETSQLNDALASNYLLVDVQLQSWGVNRTDKVASAEYVASKGTAPDAAKVSKNLLASAGKELKDVQQCATALRHFVYESTLPWSASSTGPKRGERLLATSLSMNFLKELSGMQQEHAKAVAILVSVWPTRVAEAMRALGPLADASQYPDASELPGLFSVTVDLRPVPAMGDFSRLNVPAALAGALATRHATKAQAQLDGAMANLRERICTELSRINTQLSKHANGDKTRLYDSLVTNMQGLVQLARSMNVGDNPLLSELADKIESNLLRVPVEAYKNDPRLAGEAAAAAATLISDATLEEVWEFKK